MQILDLRTIIDSSGVDQLELAAAIFPENRQPKAAFERILKRDAYLNELQISRLANFIGCSVPELYLKSRDLSFEDDLILLNVGENSARLDLRNMRLIIHKNGTLIHDQILMKKGLSVDELTEYVENWKQ